MKIVRVLLLEGNHTNPKSGGYITSPVNAYGTESRTKATLCYCQTQRRHIDMS